MMDFRTGESPRAADTTSGKVTTIRELFNLSGWDLEVVCQPAQIVFLVRHLIFPVGMAPGARLEVFSA